MSRSFAAVTIALLLSAGSAMSWAAPPQIDGIENFRKVNDRIYRGAQPSQASWPSLAKLGVKTVIDLRRETEHSIADERRAVEAAGMKYVNFPMNGFDTPTSSQMHKVLALMEGSDPVFVHCKQGRDRTGTVIATWRMAREQWPNARALAEAQECGMHWFEGGMKRFIAGYRALPAASTTTEMAVAPAAAESTATAAPASTSP